MNINEPNLSMSTLVEVSDLIGFPFGKNSVIRDAQDNSLALQIQSSSSIELNLNKKDNFFLGAVDFIIEEKNNQQNLYFLEVNGSGIGSISNICNYAFNEILETFSEVPYILSDPNPLVIIGYSDSRSSESSLPRSFIYEKFFYIDSIKSELKKIYKNCKVYSLMEAEKNRELISKIPTIIIGYQHDILKNIEINGNKVLLFGNKVSCIQNDNLCSNIQSLSSNQLDVFYINQISSLITNKCHTYKAYNQYIKTYQGTLSFPEIRFKSANNYNELVEIAYSYHKASKNIVIKPNTGCVGSGVEFLFASDAYDEIKNKINQSLSEVQSINKNNSNIFPYSISDFIDSAAINEASNPLNSHKFDLRIIVYRHSNQIKCFPSVLRATRQKYDPIKIDKQMLLNYASTADNKAKTEKFKYSLPLCNLKTMELIGLNQLKLEELCSFSAGFIKFLLDITPEKQC